MTESGCPITQKEMIVFLSISESSLIKLRKGGKIPFLQVGGRILYVKSDVLQALTKNNI